jgi:hypothetical protein
MRQPDRSTGATARALPTLCAALALLVVAGAATAPATAQPPDSPQYETWQAAPDAPFAYTRFDAEYSLETGRVYFLGGRLADSNTDGSVWSFDPATGVYEDTLVDMPVPVSNYEIARLVDASGDEILVLFGGRPSAGGVVDTVQGYYPGTNTTTVFSSDPYPVATAPGGVAVVDNIAYSFGGFDAVSVLASTYLFDILAPAGTRWTAGPSLSLARSYLGTAVVDGVVYAIGGATWDGAALHATQRVEKLDTAQPLVWDDAGVADLPAVGPGPDFGCDEMRAFGLDSAGPYTVGNLIVVAGCGQWPNEIAESMFYDVATDTWDAAGFPDLNQVRRNHAGAFIPEGDGTGGRPGFWIWGGRQGADTTVLTTPEWYPLLPLEIFSDGFESGNTNAWSFTLP